MPRLGRRSRNRKRTSKTLLGSKKTVHYRRGSTSTPHCSLCNRPIIGIKYSSISEIRKLNQTKKTISRLYGDEICPRCLKKSLKQTVRTLRLG